MRKTQEVVPLVSNKNAMHQSKSSDYPGKKMSLKTVSVQRFFKPIVTVKNEKMSIHSIRTRSPNVTRIEEGK